MIKQREKSNCTQRNKADSLDSASDKVKVVNVLLLSLVLVIPRTRRAGQSRQYWPLRHIPAFNELRSLSYHGIDHSL